MELENGIKVKGFCCDGYDWHVFDIDSQGWVYSKCANPDCKNPGVFAPKLGNVAKLRARLAEV